MLLCCYVVMLLCCYVAILLYCSYAYAAEGRVGGDWKEHGDT